MLANCVPHFHSSEHNSEVLCSFGGVHCCYIPDVWLRCGNLVSFRTDKVKVIQFHVHFTDFNEIIKYSNQQRLLYPGPAKQINHPTMKPTSITRNNMKPNMSSA